MQSVHKSASVLYRTVSPYYLKTKQEVYEGVMKEKDFNSCLGDNIKAARSAKNMTQTELAARLKITPRYLKAIENSGKKPSYSLLAMIVHELDIQCDEVFCE